MNKKVYQAVISGKSDNNIRYADFQNLIINLGFEFKRQHGSHAFYYNREIDMVMNIQTDGNKAKDYQVRQLRDIIRHYDL